MDDFFNPGEAAAAPAASDPAADFLAGDLAQVPETPTADIEIEPHQASPESAPVDLTAEFAELENQGAEVMDEDALRQMTVQGDPIQAAQSEKVDPSQIYSGISMADDRINQLKSESEAVRSWREKNQKRIDDSVTQEKVDDEQLKQTAKSQMEDFYKQYEAEKAKTKGENRNGQSPLVVKKPESTDKAWSQIGDFIDFQAARAAKQTDKERMKSLLFKLKQTPPVKGA